MAGRSTRRRGAAVVLLAGSTLASLVLAEIVLRAARPAPGFVPYSEYHLPGWLIPHPTRSYAPAPGFSGRMIAEDFAVTICMDARGLRVEPPAPERSPSPGERLGPGPPRSPDGRAPSSGEAPGRRQRRLLAAGDSFTFGWGVEAREAWPAQLEGRLNARRDVSGPFSVANAGVSAYGLPQIRDRIEELLPSIEPELLVVGLFPAGVDRIDNPFLYLNGDVVRARALPRIKPVRGGYLHSPMSRRWAQGIDFWLDERCFVGALLWKGAYRAFEAIQDLGDRSRSRKTSGTAADPSGGGAAAGPAVGGAAADPAGGAAAADPAGGAAAADPAGGAGPEPSRGPSAGERGYLSPLLLELDRIRRASSERGVPLVVLLTNAQRDDGTFREIDDRFNEIVARFGEEHRIPVLDPLAALRRRANGAPILRLSVKDAHWTAAAHAVAADALADFLMREHLLPPGPSPVLQRDRRSP